MNVERVFVGVEVFGFGFVVICWVVLYVKEWVVFGRLIGKN